MPLMYFSFSFLVINITLLEDFDTQTPYSAASVLLQAGDASQQVKPLDIS